MPEVAFAGLLIAIGVAAFVAAIRVGILIGVRLDRTMEARYAKEESAAADAESPSHAEDPGNE
jgi:hypothetical protein